MMKVTYRYLIIFLACVFCKSVFAWDCTQKVSNLTAQFPATVIIQRDAEPAIGQPLSDWAPSNGGAVAIYECDGTASTGGDSFDITEYGSASKTGTYSDGGVNYDIHPTDISGVGVVLRAKSQGTGGMSSWYNFPYGSWTGGGYYHGQVFEASMEVDARLIRTGSSYVGVLSSGNVGGVKTITPGGTSYYAIPINYSGTTVTKVACAITTPNLVFPIGDVPTSAFGNSVGFTPPQTSTQNLGLDCDAGANINVSLNATQNPDVSTTSVLALDNQGSAGTASGLGVQLLYNGTPLEINNRIVLKQSEGGQETLPITARYYQTKTMVTTGDASTSATLTLTYQ